MHYSNPDSLIDATKRPLARHHAYRLLSSLFLDGLTAVSLPTVQQIPQLGDTLPNDINLDATAATHQHLFGFNIFPYESIFLDPSGLLGGLATDAVLNSYSQAGFTPSPDSASPDHIGNELDMMAHLAGAEADAWEDDLPIVAENMQRLQREFLQSHLLRWLFPFVVTVQRQDDPFFAAVAQLTFELVSDHAQELGQTGLQPKVTQDLSGLDLPIAPALMDDDKTSLRDIAEFIVTPPYSGVYLGRDDVGRLAREIELPRGFGGRDQMLLNLIRTAVQYKTIPTLIDNLRAELGEWSGEYTAVFAQYPHIAPFIAPWQTHCQQTDQLLTDIATQIETIAQEDE